MKIHHLGFVVSALEDSIPRFQEDYGLQACSPIFTDEVQKVRVVFLSHSQDSSETQIELIQPLHSDSPVSAFLAKGGGLHHMAFGVKDIQAESKRFGEKIKSTMVCPPVPGAGHDNRLVSFFYMNQECPKGYLIELVELPPS